LKTEVDRSHFAFTPWYVHIGRKTIDLQPFLWGQKKIVKWLDNKRTTAEQSQIVYCKWKSTIGSTTLKTASRQHSLIITETSLFKAQFFEDSQTQ